jgi:dTDP-4-amino-4,6-dideoxygalactose transaminase
VPSELSCAVLYAQLEECSAITARRVKHLHFYSKYFAKYVHNKCFQVPVIAADTTTNAHIFYLLFDSEGDKLHYESELKRMGVAAFAHYCPLHSAPAGLKYGRTGSEMTVTDSAHKALLRLPIWIDMGIEEIKHVIKSVRSIAEELYVKRNGQPSSSVANGSGTVNGGTSLQSVSEEESDVMSEFNRL